MKKNMFPILLCLMIGFLMGNFIFNQYKKKTNVVSLTGENLYFLSIGSYKTKEEMKKELSNFTYYIYRKENDSYYAYIGITKDLDNLKKLKGFYKNKGYIISEKKIFVSNIAFLTVLEQYDMLLKSNDNIEAIESQVLSKYEETTNED